LQYVQAFVQAIYQPETLSLPALCEDGGGLSTNLREVLDLVCNIAAHAGAADQSHA
jgi:hypothetical protein